MEQPKCGKCGKVMTPENSKIHPEYFLHDACLPDDLRPDPKTCKHEAFDCNVMVNRIEDIGRFMADVKVECSQCKTPFRFIGLPAGVDYNGACVSVDGTEGRFAIAPKGAVLSELEGTPIGFTVRKKGG